MFIRIILITIIQTVLGNLGVDLCQSVSIEQFECLKDNGYEFVIVRIYRNVGIVDVNSAQTIKNARRAGINRVDAYLFPCVSCGDASQQAIETIEYLNDEQIQIDTLWLDIEGKWNNDTDMNIKFVEQLIQQINISNIRHGIYTSESNWFSIMNNTENFSLDSPLWYSHYDNDKSFDDFRQFGGWRRPFRKQYIADVKECGVVLDRNFS